MRGIISAFWGHIHKGDLLVGSHLLFAFQARWTEHSAAAKPSVSTWMTAPPEEARHRELECQMATSDRPAFWAADQLRLPQDRQFSCSHIAKDSFLTHLKLYIYILFNLNIFIS